jgi:hypothetical protein
MINIIFLTFGFTALMYSFYIWKIVFDILQNWDYKHLTPTDKKEFYFDLILFLVLMFCGIVTILSA